MVKAVDSVPERELCKALNAVLRRSLFLTVFGSLIQSHSGYYLLKCCPHFLFRRRFHMLLSGLKVQETIFTGKADSLSPRMRRESTIQH